MSAGGPAGQHHHHIRSSFILTQKSTTEHAQTRLKDTKGLHNLWGHGWSMHAVSAGDVSTAAAADCKGAVHQEGEVIRECPCRVGWAAEVQRHRSKQTCPTHTVHTSFNLHSIYNPIFAAGTIQTGDGSILFLQDFQFLGM